MASYIIQAAREQVYWRQESRWSGRSRSKSRRELRGGTVLSNSIECMASYLIQAVRDGCAGGRRAEGVAGVGAGGEVLLRLRC